MDKINNPEPLYFEGNVAENWRRWKQRFLIFMTATGTDKKEAEVKSATLLHFAGPEAIEIYNTLAGKLTGMKRISVVKFWRNSKTTVPHGKTLPWKDTFSTPELSNPVKV